MHRPLAAPIALVLLMSLSADRLAAQEETPDARLVVPARTLDAVVHHLGNDPVEDWPEAPVEPAGPLYALEFEARAIDGESFLLIRQRNVDGEWPILVNGTRVGDLERHGDRRLQRYALPPGVLLDGTNVLHIENTKPGDDITLGPIHLVEASLREAYDLRPVRVHVTDADGGAPLPARLTFATPDELPAELFHAARRGVAVRPGVLVTASGQASLELPRGEYLVWATRGMEWSLGRTTLVVGDSALPGAPATAALALRREVDTTGFVAVDTHIHTLTYSGHGDATLAERIVTLAAEGVELAVATDHNHNTDYGPEQRRAGLGRRYTAITGNEVTTPVGHFNAFPLDPADAPPPHDLHDWVALVDGMRASGARAVVLNHPRWPEPATGPFGKSGLDPFTGRRADAAPYAFDAMELVNATVRTPDPLSLYHDWFALLNHGERIMAVGSSDSHTVGDPAGLGRTYVESRTDDPARIDVAAVCDAVAAGRSSVAQGIFVDAVIDGFWRPGRIVPVLPDRRGKPEIGLAVRVAAPGWVRPRQVRVYVNAEEVALADVPAADDSELPGPPVDVTLPFSLDPPPHDGWLVCVVTGDVLAGPFFPSINDYAVGSSNAFLLDVDRDGAYASLAATARARLAAWERRPDPTGDAALLAGLDDAAALQLLDQLVLRGETARAREVGATRAAVSARVDAYLRALPDED
ncbi:MAG: CehA/McbA family metallohydrolase [Planctomycetota bacterium]|jgi:hypothetical protein